VRHAFKRQGPGLTTEARISVVDDTLKFFINDQNMLRVRYFLGNVQDAHEIEPWLAGNMLEARMRSMPAYKK